MLQREKEILSSSQLDKIEKNYSENMHKCIKIYWKEKTVLILGLIERFVIAPKKSSWVQVDWKNLVNGSSYAE